MHPKVHCYTCQKTIILVMKLKRKTVSVGQSVGGYLNVMACSLVDRYCLMEVYPS